jgi:NCAIR mutase (PurE)-related protein
MTDAPETDAGRPPALDLGYARLDVERAERTGDPEVVYGAGKAPAHVVELLLRHHALDHAVAAAVETLYLC